MSEPGPSGSLPLPKHRISLSLEERANQQRKSSAQLQAEVDKREEDSTYDPADYLKARDALLKEQNSELESEYRFEMYNISKRVRDISQGERDITQQKLRKIVSDRTEKARNLISLNARFFECVEAFRAKADQRKNEFLQALLASDTHAKRGKKEPRTRNFRRNALFFYGVERQDGTFIWDPILGKYLPKESMTAAHIVPQAFSDEVISHTFGIAKVSTLLSDARNCLVLHKKLEEGLDKGYFVIIPTTNRTDPLQEYKVKLVDREIENFSALSIEIGRDIKWKELEDRPLQFLNNKRPSARCLYFRMVCSVLAQLTLNKVVAQNISDGIIWATPGKWVRESSFSVLARLIGDDKFFLQLKDGTFAEESPRESDRLLSEQCFAEMMSWAVSGEEIGNDSSDEDSDEQ